LVGGFVWECRAGAQINFPESGRGLGHVTPQFLAVRSAIVATAWLLVKNIGYRFGFLVIQPVTYITLILRSYNCI